MARAGDAPTGRYHTLDAMRGAAALSVILFHFHEWLGLPIVPNGYLAVDFFFLLSGFVIDASYGRRLSSGMTLDRFTEIRLVRLYPLFLAGSVLGAIKVCGELFFKGSSGPSPQQAIVEIVLNTVMLPSPSQGDYLFALNGPAWSLFFEMVANILFALAITRVRSAHFMLVAAVTLVALIWGALGSGSLHIGWNWPTMGSGLARVLFSFSLGVVLNRAHVRGSRRFTPQAALPALILIAVLSAPVPELLQSYFDLAAVAIVFPAILWIGIHCEVPKRFVPLAAFMGDISYPVYIVHFPILTIALFAAKRTGHDPGTLFIASFVLAMIILAWFLTRFYDEPVRTWLSARLNVRRSAPAQSITA